jgi:hypothetical protein
MDAQEVKKQTHIIVISKLLIFTTYNLRFELADTPSRSRLLCIMGVFKIGVLSNAIFSKMEQI